MKILTFLTFALFCIVNSLTAENWQGPDFLVIGAQKCGTSSLYDYIVEHPSIKKAKRKEIHYFDKYLTKGIHWYKSQFPKKKKNSTFLIGEATPKYLYDPAVPQMVHDLFPDVKLIIILRNPTDRAFSHYKKKLRCNAISSSFEEAIHNDLQNKKESYENLIDLLGRGLYLEQIQRWLEFFPKEQLHIIFTKDLARNPAETMHKVFQFLNLPNYTQKNYTRSNVATNNEVTLNPETRKSLENFFRSYNNDLQAFLRKEFEMDVTLDWN